MTTSEGPAVSHGVSAVTSSGEFEVLLQPAAAVACDGAILPVASDASDSRPNVRPGSAVQIQSNRKRKAGETPQPLSTRKNQGERHTGMQSGTPSISQPEGIAPSGAGSGVAAGADGATTSRQARTPPAGLRKGAAQQSNNIRSYFGPRGSPQTMQTSSNNVTAVSESEGTEGVQMWTEGCHLEGNSSRRLRSDGATSAVDATLRQRCSAAEADVHQLRLQLEQLKGEHMQQMEAMADSRQTADALIKAAEEEHTKFAKELAAVRREREQHHTHAQALVARLAIDRANEARDAAALRIRANTSRLGSFSCQRQGPIGWWESWEDGQAYDELNHRLMAIAQQKEGITAAQKAVKKQLPPPLHPQTSGQGGAPGTTSATEAFVQPSEYVARDEVFKVRIAALKREEDQLGREKDALDVAKLKHQRELRRLRDESGCRFGDRRVLSKRYLVGNLLGKGGFSDVYSAVDLVAMRQVAVKVHQLDSSWDQARKGSYVKHAVREYQIHKGLCHPRVVALFDIFEIDSDSFATVLEVAAGGDLAWHLQQHKVLPEKEARVIAAQVAAGLLYINGPRHRIIHYDLKPANILFNQYGEVKITDFGLSKVAPEGMGANGFELTSQGAGTYWYLPPECFETGAPRITNKVDVWSLGVILFQMLYGRRPFGEGISQDRIRDDNVMLDARVVEFPTRPSVSQEAKDFISRCLAYRAADRLDVEGAAAHPYLALKRPNTRSAAAKEAAALATIAVPPLA